MKGTKDGETSTICVKKGEKDEWANEKVRFFDCGGSDCCRFSFVDAPKGRQKILK